MPFAVFLEDEAKEQLADLDNSVRIKVLKKLKQLEIKDVGRHLEKGLPHFVEEVGQYRIAFVLKLEISEKRVVFIGDHKEYETWIHSQ